MSNTRFNYKHPAFYSRKHPLYARLDGDTRVALMRWLDLEGRPI